MCTVFTKRKPQNAKMVPGHRLQKQMEWPAARGCPGSCGGRGAIASWTSSEVWHPPFHSVWSPEGQEYKEIWRSTNNPHTCRGIRDCNCLRGSATIWIPPYKWPCWSHYSWLCSRCSESNSLPQLHPLLWLVVQLLEDMATIESKKARAPAPA